MSSLREYILQLCAVALLCSVVLRLARGSGAVKTMIKLLCGVILAYSVIQPVKQLQLPDLEQYTAQFREEAEQAACQGKDAAVNALIESISEGTETYILEKAKALNLDMVVEVELSDDEIPVPVAVTLTGNTAPYAKTVLEKTIEQELNIPKENQIWISH